MSDVQRVDVVRVSIRGREGAATFPGETLGGGARMLHHRYAPYTAGSTP